MRKSRKLLTLWITIFIYHQEKERAKDLESASKFCENLCNDFVSIASSSESAGKIFHVVAFLDLVKNFNPAKPCWPHVTNNHEEKTNVVGGKL